MLTLHRKLPLWFLSSGGIRIHGRVCWCGCRLDDVGALTLSPSLALSLSLSLPLLLLYTQRTLVCLPPLAPSLALSRTVWVCGHTCTCRYCAQNTGTTLGLISSYPNEAALLEKIGVDLKAAEAKAGKKPRAIIMGALGRCGSGAVSFLEKAGFGAEQIVKWDMAETKGGG